MIFQRKWRFGLGTVFSLILVYFIYLYAADKGWKLLASVSKWYLIIVVFLIAIPLIIIFLIVSLSFFMILIAYIKTKSMQRKFKNKKQKRKYTEYVDAEYKVKE